jgi:hypothetical protein
MVQVHADPRGQRRPILVAPLLALMAAAVAAADLAAAGGGRRLFAAADPAADAFVDGGVRAADALWHGVVAAGGLRLCLVLRGLGDERLE